MPDLNHRSFLNLINAIEDSIDILENKSIENMSERVLRILDHLNFYETAICQNYYYPELQRICIADYRIYRTVVKRHCERLLKQHSRKRWFGATTSNERYVRHLEWVSMIVNNHFIYWEWKSIQNETNLNESLGEK